VIIERDSNWQHAYREVAEDLVTVRRVVAEARSRTVAPAKSA